MKIYIQCCLSMLVCISLCHGAADSTKLYDVHELNRTLVKLTQSSPRAELYTYNSASEIIPASPHPHPMSKLKITGLCHSGGINVWVLESTNEDKVIWDNAFTSHNPSLAQAMWYDIVGEQIAVRLPGNTHQQIYRVSYMSLLQKLDTHQRSYLVGALTWLEKYKQRVHVYPGYGLRLYSSLPQELQLPALFDLTYDARLSQLASAALSCFRACHRVRWLLASGQ